MKRSKRFLPRKPRGSPKEITHQQIAEALSSFQRSGGLIRRLPDQPDERRIMVGNPWHALYEDLFES